jgi:hypothetical protein
MTPPAPLPCFSRRGLAAPLAGALALLGAAAGGAAEPPAVRARLDVERAGEMWTFAVQLEADAAAQVEYQLFSAVDGAGGRSSNQQRGAARLQPGEPQQPSRSTLRIRPGDRYCVTLRVLAAGGVIATERVSSDAESAAGTSEARPAGTTAPCEEPLAPARRARPRLPREGRGAAAR